MARKRFAVLDRDGTIIADQHYLREPEKVRLLPNAAAGLRRMRELGLGLAVVTNQSGVGRGYFDEACVERVHNRLRELLAQEGVALDGIYFCPHTAQERCECRKPRPGLLLRAAAELGFEPRDCFVIGDKPCDLELGRNAGAVTLLVQTGYGAELESAQRHLADHTAADLAAAAAVIARL